MNNTGYSMECPSFDDFMKEKKHPKKKKEKPTKPLVPVERNEKRTSLAFAHPVDAGIIKVLDNPVINKVFTEVIRRMIDTELGLLISSGIRVDHNDSKLSSVVKKCAAVMGINVPYTVISSSLQGQNALCTGTDDYPYIIISSRTSETMSEEELQFVVGHECGHIALGHLIYHAVGTSIQDISELLIKMGPMAHSVISWPLNAWSRRSEISADRAGLLCCGDIQAACKALLRTEADMMNIDDINLEEYIKDANQELKKSRFGRWAELRATHPILSKRMEALRLFYYSEKYYRVSGKLPPADRKLLTDEELERETEKILNVIIWSDNR